MHVIPLPFGLALALLPRSDAQRLSKPKQRPTRTDTLLAPRDRVARNRYAEFQQVL